MPTDKNFGFKIGDLLLIINVLKDFPQIESALIFGSRAKGNYRPGSDIDLALSGRELDFRALSDINFRLNEETPLPYHFDVLITEKTENRELVAHIHRCGIPIYEKSQPAV